MFKAQYSFNNFGLPLRELDSWIFILKIRDSNSKLILRKADTKRIKSLKKDLLDSENQLMNICDSNFHNNLASRIVRDSRREEDVSEGR